MNSTINNIRAIMSLPIRINPPFVGPVSFTATIKCNERADELFVEELSLVNQRTGNMYFFQFEPQLKCQGRTTDTKPVDPNIPSIREIRSLTKNTHVFALSMETSIIIAQIVGHTCNSVASYELLPVSPQTLNQTKKCKVHKVFGEYCTIEQAKLLYYAFPPLSKHPYQWTTIDFWPQYYSPTSDSSLESPESPRQNSVADSDIEEMPFSPQSPQYDISEESDITGGPSSPETQQRDDDIEGMPSSPEPQQQHDDTTEIPSSSNIQEEIDSDIEIVDL
jgi:hypothetical protein